ncbi:YibE/F family protein [Candidatus Roizmanbacteria bacterium]|nr:YibE/F family protein [Candidatus Roizmanbacteria bacterium]
MKHFLICLLLLFIFPLQIQAASNTTYTRAKITAIRDQHVTLSVTEGNLKGRIFEATIASPGGKELEYQKGDAIFISYEKDKQSQEHVYIVDYVRSKQLLMLFFLFIALVFAVGRWKGVASFAGMIFSFIVIMNLIIPNILLGNDPVLIALLGSLFILPVTFYISHGLNKKTTVALVGTFLSLAITGALAYLFVVLTRITGLAVEEATYLQMIQGGALNVRNLLLAGIIISAMGVLDDITISQTAIVEQLSIANPKYSKWTLYKHAMEVGRDHIASLVNTLILVYAGASLPLFLLFYNAKISYISVINQEIVTIEIVRTLVSSIGIVAAVPITTFITCMVMRKKG